MSKFNFTTSSGLTSSNVVDKLSNASGDTLSNYIIDILYKLPSKGWDALLDGKYFDGLQSSVESTHNALQHFNYFLGLNISDTPWYIIKNNFFVKDKPEMWLFDRNPCTFDSCTFISYTAFKYQAYATGF